MLNTARRPRDEPDEAPRDGQPPACKKKLDEMIASCAPSIASNQSEDFSLGRPGRSPADECRRPPWCGPCSASSGEGLANRSPAVHTFVSRRGLSGFVASPEIARPFAS